MPNCRCTEKTKPLSERNWKIESRQPYKHYGPNAASYDGRRLLNLECLSCGNKWGNADKNSKYWDFIKETPYSNGKRQ